MHRRNTRVATVAVLAIGVALAITVFSAFSPGQGRPIAYANEGMPHTSLVSGANLRLRTALPRRADPTPPATTALFGDRGAAASNQIPLELALIGAIATLLAAILGVLITHLLSQRAFKQRERTQRINVRLLLRVEAQHDLTALADFCKAVGRTQPRDKRTAPETPADRARRVAEIPLPQWEHTMWRSLVQLLPASLSQDELTALFALHTEIDSLSAIQRKLEALDEEERNYRQAQRTAAGEGNEYQRLRKRRIELGEQFDQLSGALMQRGNPLDHQESSAPQQARWGRPRAVAKRLRNLPMARRAGRIASPAQPSRHTQRKS